jgi:cathepsin F
MFRLCFVAALLAAAAGSALADTQSVERDFEALAKLYGREYLLNKHKMEKGARLKFFKNNLATIERLSRENPDAVFKPNEFFDFSEAELLSRRTMPGDAKAMAVSCLAHGVTSSGEVAKLRKANAAPAEWDWTKQGKVTPVKNQGQCGSCWTFSTTGSIESAWAIKSGKAPVGLSEQEIVDCSHGCADEPPYGKVCNQGCNGGWPWSAMTDIISWPGLATESAYPYTATTGVCHKTQAMDSSPIKNYTCLSGTGAKGDGPANEADMKNFLYTHGPLSIALDASPLMFYHSGVIAPPTSCSQARLDHALLITGYGTYQSSGQQKDYWLVKNSWGASWGAAGYFKIFRGANMCGIAAAVSHPIAK